MERGVNKLLEGTGEAIKTVPELYEDGPVLKVEVIAIYK